MFAFTLYLSNSLLYSHSKVLWHACWQTDTGEVRRRRRTLQKRAASDQTRPDIVNEHWLQLKCFSFSSFSRGSTVYFRTYCFRYNILKHKEQTEIPFLRTPFVRPSRLWLLIPIRIGKRREQRQRKPAADWPPKSNCGIIESVNTLYCNNKFTSTKDISFLIHRHLWVEEMNFKLIQSFSSFISDATGLLLFLVHKGGPQNQ